MIGISKLYLGNVEPSDALRYGRDSSRLPSHLLQFSADKRPVVVWNVTPACNLRCGHCYARATAGAASNQLSLRQGRALIDDLSAFGCPVLLLSGGEPLARADVIELAEYAVAAGMRVVLSTNGTLIDDRQARRLKQIGLSYVGVSLDGLRETHDRFRGCAGAFDRSLAGIRACRDAGIKVGLRCTITRTNRSELPGIFDLMEQENIPRACFYHLVCTGRGEGLAAEHPDHAQTRETVDYIIDRTAAMQAAGEPREILTVDNHADGAYLYLRMRREGKPGAANVLELLRMNGGNASGVGIGCVSWDGTVFPDQFWRTHPMGHVLERPFSEIWTDRSDPFSARLEHKGRYVTGRCAHCRFLDICGGNLRARAEAATGDPWACDPACYLTDEEVGIA